MIYQEREYQRCTKCNLVKPVCEYYKSSYKSALGFNMYRSACKKCSRKINGNRFKELSPEKKQRLRELRAIRNERIKKEDPEAFREARRKAFRKWIRKKGNRELHNARRRIKAKLKKSEIRCRKLKG